MVYNNIIETKLPNSDKTTSQNVTIQNSMEGRLPPPPSPTPPFSVKGWGIKINVKFKAPKLLRKIERLVFNCIPQNSKNKPRGLYFSKALFEGLIFGGAYVRREICVSKSIELACSGKEIYHFCFVLLCIWGQIPCTSPPGGLYPEGRFNGGFFALQFWGAYIWRG